MADLEAHGITADRPGRGQPLPVRQRPRHRADRHRRADHGAGRGQEPRPRRHRRRPGRLRRRARRAAGATGASATPPAAAWPAPPSPTPRPTTPPSCLVRRGGPARPARCRPTLHLGRPSGPRTCATARTPTRSAPATAAPGERSWWDDATQHGGKELSYLNLYDAEAAWRLVHALGERPAAVVIKHANPCGAAVADDLTDAYTRAHECDPVSAFGGIVAVNRSAAARVGRGPGPRVHRGGRRPGLRGRRARGARRPRRTSGCSRPRPPGAPGLQLRTIDGGFLVQTPDPVDRRPVGLDRVATERAPTDDEWRRPRAGLAPGGPGRLQRHRAGQGRPGRGHRRRPAEPPGRRRASPPRRPPAGPRAGPTPSDAFFPFPDGLDGAVEAGATAGHPARRLRSATTRSSPPPTSTAWPWSSPANATSGTDDPADRETDGRDGGRDGGPRVGGARTPPARRETDGRNGGEVGLPPVLGALKPCPERSGARLRRHRTSIRRQNEQILFWRPIAAS